MLLILMGNALWWPLVVVGGLLFCGDLNGKRPSSLWYHFNRQPNKLLILAFVYLLIGAGQETAGYLLNVWTYQGVYASLWMRALLVLFGYPLFLALVNETFVIFRSAPLVPWVAWLSTLVLLVGWSELPNLIAPLYHVNPPFETYRALIFVGGYALQVILAVWARRVLLSEAAW